MLKKYAVLLLNLGTPKNSSQPEVRRYLREFLSDKRVIDLPAPLRYLLVNAFIVPLRSPVSARAYKKIWTDQGSPLLVNNHRLAQKLALALGEEYSVSLAMRYGQPNIPEVISKLLSQNLKKLIVLPLFPQYSSAATGSALEQTLTCLKQIQYIPSFSVVDSFYDHPLFIQAWRQVVTEYLSKMEAPDMWLFSYHGLPVRQFNQLNCDINACMTNGTCLPIANDFSSCYRHQCYKTTQLLAQSLGLNPEQYHVCFQSRLGKTPWITPYTDLLLPKLSQQGVKRLAVVCPSFVCDCLETLEEIGIRARQQWLKLGGTELTLIPCLNDHPAWIQALTQLVTTYTIPLPEGEG